MKFFINGVEVAEEEFQDKFLNMRILDEEQNDLSLIYVRALAAMMVPQEKQIEFNRMVSSYETRRCFRNGPFVSIMGQLFEIREDQPKEGE